MVERSGECEHFDLPGNGISYTDVLLLVQLAGCGSVILGTLLPISCLSNFFVYIGQRIP